MPTEHSNIESYDDECEAVRNAIIADACMLIVVDGRKGTGIGISAPPDMCKRLPMVFRAIAKEIEDWLTMEANVILCPACRAPLSFDPKHPLQPQQTPSSGAITVCAECAHILKRESDASWSVMSYEELFQLPDNDRLYIVRMQRAMKRAKP